MSALLCLGGSGSPCPCGRPPRIRGGRMRRRPRGPRVWFGPAPRPLTRRVRGGLRALPCSPLALGVLWSSARLGRKQQSRTPCQTLSASSVRNLEMAADIHAFGSRFARGTHTHTKRKNDVVIFNQEHRSIECIGDSDF